MGQDCDAQREWRRNSHRIRRVVPPKCKGPSVPASGAFAWFSNMSTHFSSVSYIASLTAATCTDNRYTMDSPKLTRQEADAFREKVRPILNYFNRCVRRLEAKNFTDKCELFKSVKKARDALFSLHVDLIYLACGRGVGSPEDEEVSKQKPPVSLESEAAGG